MARTLKSVDAHARRQAYEGRRPDGRRPRDAANTPALRIPGSANVALSRLRTIELPARRGQAVVFFCASGNRTNVQCRAAWRRRPAAPRPMCCRAASRPGAGPACR